MEWTEDKAKNNPIVKSLYAYYINRNRINNELLVKELIEFKLEERLGQINSTAIDVFAVYLDFSDIIMNLI